MVFPAVACASTPAIPVQTVPEGVATLLNNVVGSPKCSHWAVKYSQWNQILDYLSSTVVLKVKCTQYDKLNLPSFHLHISLRHGLPERGVGSEYRRPKDGGNVHYQKGLRLI
jgi:hypothetical protein